MESTWESRDLPVLEAVARYIDERGGSHYPKVFDIAEITGRHMTDALRALLALQPTYLEVRSVGHPEHWTVARVTDEGRRAVGQWPSPDLWVERLVEALCEAAEREPDPEKKGRLRAMAEGLGGFARDVAVGVLSGGITQSMGT
jgi:hypothetical protein